MSESWKTYKIETTLELSFQLCGHNVLVTHQKPRSLVLPATGSSPGKHIQMFSWTRSRLTLPVFILSSERSPFVFVFLCIGIKPEVLCNASKCFNPLTVICMFFFSPHLCLLTLRLLGGIFPPSLSTAHSHFPDFRAPRQHVKARLTLQPHYHIIIR